MCTAAGSLVFCASLHIDALSNANGFYFKN